jgi:hypothetical protein
MNNRARACALDVAIGTVETPRGPRMQRSALLTLLALVLTACTAVKAEVTLINADQALARARAADAPTLAPYEYTMAVRFLEKAREEAGYASYKAADDLADKSAEWSDAAVITIERTGKGVGIDDAGSDIQDSMSRPPPDPPTGAVPPPDNPPPSTPTANPDGSIPLDDENP